MATATVVRKSREELHTIYRKKLERANEAHRTRDLSTAEKIYRWYLKRVDDKDPAILFNMAVLLNQKSDKKNGDYHDPVMAHEAAEFYERCINVPDIIPQLKSDAMQNLGVMMRRAGRPDKAMIAFRFALDIWPDNAIARTNFGDELVFNLKFEEADKEYEHVLKLKPDDPAARLSRGMVQLVTGDLKNGFANYEYRFGVQSFPTKPYVSVRPKWQGEDLSGRILMLTEEQGFGDTFMFLRYVRELKAKWPTCQVWFCGHMALPTITLSAIGMDRTFVSPGKEYYDYHCPLLSLPYFLGTDSLESIPTSAPYILRNNLWPNWELPEQSEKRKIGLCWAGSPRHGRDKWRSLEPEQVQPIIDAHPECQFYSFQVGPKGGGRNDKKQWVAGEVSRLNGIIDLSPTINAWTDTAQALRHMDLLVSCDTALVHLAGAIDTACHMLCPSSPDWRWMLGREDSPWYPRLRIFRQRNREEGWGEVISQVVDAL